MIMKWNVEIMEWKTKWLSSPQIMKWTELRIIMVDSSVAAKPGLFAVSLFYCLLVITWPHACQHLPTPALHILT